MSKLISNSKLFFKRNSSTILTVVGAIGVAATAVMSARDTIKAVKRIEEHEAKGEKLSNKEKFKIAAPAYIPTVATGLSTIACIFGANVLNKKAQASLASSYALLDRSYKEYKSAVIKEYGDDADKKIKETVAQSYYENNDLVRAEEGEELFFDFHGLQLFSATMEDVCRAEEAVNQILSRDGRVGLNIFYSMLGIKCADIDYEQGWSFNTCHEQGYSKIEFVHELVNNANGTNYYSITMLTEPVDHFMWW